MRSASWLVGSAAREGGTERKKATTKTERKGSRSEESEETECIQQSSVECAEPERNHRGRASGATEYRLTQD